LVGDKVVDDDFDADQAGDDLEKETLQFYLDKKYYFFDLNLKKI
jgi:thiaminase